MDENNENFTHLHEIFKNIYFIWHEEKGEIFRISFKRDLVPILVGLFKSYYPPNFGSKLAWQVVVMIFVHLAIINLIFEF
jgi:hypothetical protein